MKGRGFSYWPLLTLLFAPYLCGCFTFTVSTKPVIRTAEGGTAPPPADPVVGSTTEQELANLYRNYRVDLGTPSLFWAHMNTSQARLFFNAVPEREWGTLNMVITLDPNRVVRSINSFPDGKMPEEVASMFRQGQLPAFDFSTPVQLEGLRLPERGALTLAEMPLKLSLAKSSLSITMFRCKSWRCRKPTLPETFNIPSQQISSLTMENPGNDFHRTEYTVKARILFKSKAEFGSNLTFLVRFSDALTMSRWLAQTASAI